LPSLAAPEPVRLTRRGGGPNAVMRGQWVDPADVSPNASRRPRQTHYWRRYDPLRRMMQATSSAVVAEHVIAADLLRAAADVAALGYAPPPPLDPTWPIRSTPYLPRAGPAGREHARVAAWRDYVRAMRRFTADQRRLVAGVVLQCLSVRRWCQDEADRTGRKLCPRVTLGRLVACLDILAEHYASEVERAQQRGGAV
jgi:hypothetical protein